MKPDTLVIRNVPPKGSEKSLYLTFDDGPDPVCTPRVLDLLSEYGGRATFFLIGEKAKKYPGLVREILARGHTLGNHSPDHRYSHYFSGRRSLREWITAGENAIGEASGTRTIGFRPPAGVRTPELVKAAQDLGTPLILWRTRFFDSVFAPSTRRMVSSLSRVRAGDIVLLHDAQMEKNRETFLLSLRAYLEEAKARSFVLRALERNSLA